MKPNQLNTELAFQTLVVLGSVLFLTISSVWAAESSQYDRNTGRCDKLVKDKIGECGDLRGHNFDLLKMKETKLRGANLTRAQFRLSQLYRTDLCGANLRGAMLEGADLTFTTEDDRTKWKGARADQFTKLPKSWGNSREERIKKAKQLGIKFVAPPYNFYRGSDQALFNFREKMKTIKNRSQANNVDVVGADTEILEQKLSKEEVDEEFFN